MKGEAVTTGVQRGDLLTVTATIEKIKGIKDKNARKNNYAALVNKTTGQMAIDLYDATEDLVTKEFQHQMRDPGTNSFKVYTFSGNGSGFDTSFDKDVMVK